jgi:hypothetical protein
MKHPEEALKDICHISERTFNTTIYTFRDIRYPEYNGSQVEVFLCHGREKCRWIKKPKKTNA